MTDPTMQPTRASRTRWAAVGAAIAVSIGGGVAVTDAITSSGQRAVFVPISPCRLFDTRALSVVGPRNTPMGPGESIVMQVTGANGNCLIPSDATAVAMNVTTNRGTSASYLTLWPSDAARPLASSLNWVAGSPPTPNKVDVKLSADGKVSLFNEAGNVDVLADVVGYYVDHDHDDRYYTKAQSDAALAAKAPKPTGSTDLVIGQTEFQPQNGFDGTDAIVHDFNQNRVNGGSATPICATAPLRVPSGATITQLLAYIVDGNAAVGVHVSIFRARTLNIQTDQLAEVTTGVAYSDGGVAVFPSDASIVNPVVDTSQYSYYLVVCNLTWTSGLMSAVVTYTNP